MKKIIATILAIIIAVSALSLIASANAKPFMNWKQFDNQDHDNGNHYAFGHISPGKSNPKYLNSTMVRVDANVTGFGTEKAIGTARAQTKTVVINGTEVHEGASATAIWTTNTSRPINSIRDKGNFTYSFCTAKLVTQNVTGLNIGTSDFFINGTWTVYNVTTTFTVVTDANGDVVSRNHNQNAVALATKAYGELNVTGNWAAFKLSITGVKDVTGKVLAEKITQRGFNSFKIENDQTNTVTPTDIKGIAKAYGSMPGNGNYDQRMDYNFNYKIDITDLATAAANLNL